MLSLLLLLLLLLRLLLLLLSCSVSFLLVLATYSPEKQKETAAFSAASAAAPTALAPAATANGAPAPAAAAPAAAANAAAAAGVSSKRHHLTETGAPQQEAISFGAPLRVRVRLKETDTSLSKLLSILAAKRRQLLSLAAVSFAALLAPRGLLCSTPHAVNKDACKQTAAAAN